MSRTPILHVDMDAFYASVATRERPDLAAVPVIVGGAGRGVVLSANYLARRYGVRSAMPMSRARRICPDAVVLPPDFEEFAQVSSAVMEVFRQVTPVVEALSLDEAFLDVSSVARRYGGPRGVAEWVRAAVHDEQRITCSVGIAASPVLAKLATRRAKPDGVYVVEPEEVTSFLHPLDVDELWGVGEKTAAQLRRLGLFTVGDLAHTSVTTLQRALGTKAGAHLHELAWGVDRRVLVPRSGPHAPENSMGADSTFAHDVDDADVLARELLRLTAKVTGRMRAAEVAGRTVTLRVRFADFTTVTRSRTLPEATDVTLEVYAVVTDLFAALGLQRARIRLVGVRVERLLARSAVHRQLLLGEREQGWTEAERAVDAATRRFGVGSVGPASLLR